ncbi:MAG: hypothetical protein H6810_07440 [Phycisphaeraceae bacterium]|nr:MAG: hypothetical protein H6810_07440 [Phycisphaeraceae bacterium]
MQHLLSDMLQMLNDPSTRHAAFVHLPIALALLAPIPLIASMILGDKNRAPRYAAIGAYALLAILAYVTAVSGEAASDHMGPAPGVVGALVHDHEEMAEKVWMFALGACVLVAGGLLKKKGVAATSTWLGLATGLFLALWIAAAAHKGGMLVYEYGAGTPKPMTEKDISPDPSAVSIDPRLDFFLSDVRPVLVDRCMGCHRADKARGGLDLSSMATILDGGDDGPVLTPGNAMTSVIYTSVAGIDPELQMPKRGGPLTDAQIEAIRRWIDEGAVWGE